MFKSDLWDECSPEKKIDIVVSIICALWPNSYYISWAVAWLDRTARDDNSFATVAGEEARDESLEAADDRYFGVHRWPQDMHDYDLLRTITEAAADVALAAEHLTWYEQGGKGTKAFLERAKADAYRAINKLFYIDVDEVREFAEYGYCTMLGILGKEE